MTRCVLKFVIRKFQLDWKNWELDEPTFGMEWRCCVRTGSPAAPGKPCIPGSPCEANEKIKLLIFRPTFSEIAISMSIEIVTTISLLPHFSLIRSRL